MSDAPVISQRTNEPVAGRIAAKLAAISAEPAVDAGEATETSGGETEHVVTETPVAEVTTETREEPTTEEQAQAEIRKTKHALLEEKLKERREANQARNLAARAKADRQAAKAEREAAAAERAKYDGLKTGSFKETLAALGRDPRKTWEEMNREAIEASSPEAQAKREREEAQRALDERFKPVLSELEQLRAERKHWAEQSHERSLVSGFQQAAADPAFKDLRIEYADDALLDHAKHYDQHPHQLFAAAKQYGVRLTAPEKGFTMHELLQVLSAAQAAHNAGVQARRAALSPAEPQSAAPPTVNGTAPRRNAGTAVGNDLASQRASAKAETPGMSVKERVRARMAEEIRKSGG